MLRYTKQYCLRGPLTQICVTWGFNYDKLSLINEFLKKSSDF